MLNLIAATHAEAQPVIAALRLKKTAGTIPCYQKYPFCLVVSGMGKCNTSTACGWLAATSAHASKHRSSNKSTAWLNFGIAGHPTAAIGKLLRAHKITDHTSKKVWYPHHAFRQVSSSGLTTVENPLENYLPDQLHDMEASAFVESARQFSYSEIVQSLKVTSDNADQPHSKVTTQLATKLITDNIDQLVTCIEELIALAETIAPSSSTLSQTIFDQWQFSVSQTIQAERLIERYSVLHSTIDNLPALLDECKSAKEVLSVLKSSVDNTEVIL